jgi:sec-independent protein translocase protein TatA
LLFGKGKIPSLMADMAKGIKSFKSNMADDDKSSNPDQDNQNKDQ